LTASTGTGGPGRGPTQGIARGRRQVKQVLRPSAQTRPLPSPVARPMGARRQPLSDARGPSSSWCQPVPLIEARRPKAGSSRLPCISLRCTDSIREKFKSGLAAIPSTGEDQFRCPGSSRNGRGRYRRLQMDSGDNPYGHPRVRGRGRDRGRRRRAPPEEPRERGQARRLIALEEILGGTCRFRGARSCRW
jgi:hypothetical protein